MTDSTEPTKAKSASTASADKPRRTTPRTPKQKADPKANRWKAAAAAGIGVGVGSAAIVAALMYTNRSRNEPPKD